MPFPISNNNAVAVHPKIFEVKKNENIKKKKGRVVGLRYILLVANVIAFATKAAVATITIESRYAIRNIKNISPAGFPMPWAGRSATGAENIKPTRAV